MILNLPAEWSNPIHGLVLILTLLGALVLGAYFWVVPNVIKVCC